MKITISKNNKIEIFASDNLKQGELPFLRQACFPDGSLFVDKAQAQTWAETLVESMNNPESEYIPGDSPEEPKKLRPEPEELDPETGLPVEPAEVINEEPV